MKISTEIFNYLNYIYFYFPKKFRYNTAGATQLTSHFKQNTPQLIRIHFNIHFIEYHLIYVVDVSFFLCPTTTAG